jgi:hypothetical protein
MAHKPQFDQHFLNKTAEAFDNLRFMVMGIDLPGVKGTAWAAYNAAIEWADYQFPTWKKDDTARIEAILWGKANEFKQDAFDHAMALVRR